VLDHFFSKGIYYFLYTFSSFPLSYISLKFKEEEEDGARVDGGY